MLPHCSGIELMDNTCKLFSLFYAFCWQKSVICSFCSDTINTFPLFVLLMKSSGPKVRPRLMKTRHLGPSLECVVSTVPLDSTSIITPLQLYGPSNPRLIKVSHPSIISFSQGLWSLNLFVILLFFTVTY